jgi:tetratricopeptide (TPR) repeat protein
MGYLTTGRGDFERAFFHFALAKQIYAQTGQEERVYKAYLGLANAAIAQRDETSAREYLEEAKELAPEDDVAQAIYFGLEKKLAGIGGDYESALAWSRVLYDISLADQDKIGMIGALNDIAFFSMLEGDFSEIEKTLNESEAMAVELGLSHQRQFNKICRILLARCNGQPTDQAEADVHAWLEVNPHPNLQESLELVLTWTCD